MRFSLQTGPDGSPTPQSAATGDLPSLGQPNRPRPSGVVKTLGLFLAILGIVAVVAVGIGVPGVKQSVSSLWGSTKSDVITVPIRPGKLSVIVKEKGNLESAANKDVICEVEGGTTIIMIKPEGTKVKEGEIVAELDSAALRDSLTNQKIATQQAEASYKQAKLVREVAEYAVKEYELGIYLQDKATYMGQIALARSDQERAIDRLKWSTGMFGKGYVSKATNIADQLTKQQADFDLEQAQMQLKVLEDYTKEKQIKSLRSDVEKAKADEYSKQSSFTLEQTKEKKLERQIEKCTLRAPGDGIVVYANDPGRMGGGGGGQASVMIEEGAAVYERKKIFSLPDITKMRVNTKVNESMMDKIGPGLRSLVRVDAAANEVIKGQVVSVAPMADANQMFNSDIKVYTTMIALEGDTTKLNLRPGMTAQVEILVKELDDVLSVPVQSILEFKGKDYVFIKTGDGFQRVEITLGVSNDQHVQVLKGINSGDNVAMNPVTLLSDDERNEAFSAAAKDAAKKDFSGDPNAKGALPKAGAGPDGAPGDQPKAKAKGKGQRGAGGGMMGTPEEQAKFKAASPEEKRKILEERGVPADRIDGMLERMNNGGGGRGGPGGGGFGPGGGGPGGGAGGAGQ